MSAEKDPQDEAGKVDNDDDDDDDNRQNWLADEDNVGGGDDRLIRSRCILLHWQ